MKKMIKDYITNNKKLKELTEKEKQEKDKINGSYWIFKELKAQGKADQEIKEAIQKQQTAEDEAQKTIQNLQTKKKIYNIKENILYNNIIISIYNKYKEDINNIMLKYEGKAIGEKTKEKIQNEIKDILQKDENFKNDDIFIYIQNNFNYYDRYYFKITIELSKKENYPDGGYHFIYQFKMSINYGKYTNCYENIENKKYIDITAIYNYNDEKVLYSDQFDEIEKNNNYNFIEDPEKTAKNIIKEVEKNKKQFETIKNKLIDIRKANDAALHNIKLSYQNYDIYKINDRINLY